MSFISLATDMTLGAGGRVDSMYFPGAMLRERMAQQAQEQWTSVRTIPAGQPRNLMPPIYMRSGRQPPIYQPPPPVLQPPEPPAPPPPPPPPPEWHVAPPGGDPFEPPEWYIPPPKEKPPYYFPPIYDPIHGHRPEPHGVIPPPEFPTIERPLTPPGQWPHGAHPTPIPMPVPVIPPVTPPVVHAELPPPGPWPPDLEPVPIPMPLPVIPPERMPRAAIPTMAPAQAAAARSAAYSARALPALPGAGMDPIAMRTALEPRYFDWRSLYPRIGRRAGDGYRQGLRREIDRRFITPRR